MNNGVFLENCIDGKELANLSLSDIKDLIREIGLRNKFMRNYNILVSKFYQKWHLNVLYVVLLALLMICYAM